MENLQMFSQSRGCVDMFILLKQHLQFQLYKLPINFKSKKHGMGLQKDLRKSREML